MSRFISIILIVILINFSWPYIKEQAENPGQALDSLHSEADSLNDSPEVKTTAQGLIDDFWQLLNQAGLLLSEIKQESNPEPIKAEKVDLTSPGKLFSIYNIELGTPKAAVDQALGAPKRSTLNEYGHNWAAYHKNYQGFIMVMYDKENKAAGLFTNQDLIASTTGIKRGTAKDVVREKLGEPLTGLTKGNTIYQFEKKADYDIFLKDGIYVTVFYDKHEGNTVTALQLIRQDLEDAKPGLYSDASPELKEGFEFQMFDLTNSERLMHGLPLLTWDEHVRGTARKHSADMAKNNYFDHTNLDGESPFDRMEEDHIKYNLAGENLAYGQFSSIFAHEGLMNSHGHRENILRDGYEYLGVGVAFNGNSQPYYTQNYYAN